MLLGCELILYWSCCVYISNLFRSWSWVDCNGDTQFVSHLVPSHCLCLCSTNGVAVMPQLYYHTFSITHHYLLVLTTYSYLVLQWCHLMFSFIQHIFSLRAAHCLIPNWKGLLQQSVEVPIGVNKLLLPWRCCCLTIWQLRPRPAEIQL